MTKEIALELAGITLNRGSPWPLADVFIPPQLRIDGDTLRWGSDSDDRFEVVQVVRDPRGMLARFSRIIDARGTLAFAKAHGTLGICRHGLPAAHKPAPTPTPAKVEAGRDVCYPIGWPWDVREPVARWLHFARQARSLLGIAATLHRVRRTWPGRDHDQLMEDWATVFADEGGERAQKLATIVTEDRRMSVLYLREMVNLWLRLGNVRPNIRWDGPTATPSLELGGGTFALLAVELAVAVTRSHDLSVCDGCQTPYLREGRRPQAGRRNYCVSCRAAGIPVRDRKRMHRARMTRARASTRSRKERV